MQRLGGPRRAGRQSLGSDQPEHDADNDYADAHMLSLIWSTSCLDSTCPANCFAGSVCHDVISQSTDSVGNDQVKLLPGEVAIELLQNHQAVVVWSAPSRQI